MVLDKGKAYEGNPDMFYKKTTEVKLKISDIARSFLAKSYINMGINSKNLHTYLLNVG